MAVVAAWLPFLHRPLGPDESGYLLVAQQWRPGTSLYGDYWVDRPPLLIWLFSLAGQATPIGHSAFGATAPAVKLLGALASGVTVLLTGMLGRLVAPDSLRRRAAALVLTAVLLISPLLGMPEANGEVLAVPFVMAGLVCLAAMLREPSAYRAAALATGAGAVGMCAALVKQNIVDVVVFGAVLLVTARRRLAAPWATVAAFAGGALVLLWIIATAARAQGTSPAGLWDATVTFRLDAMRAISASGSPATAMRSRHLLEEGLASGLGALLVVSLLALLTSRHRDRALRRSFQTQDPAALRGALVLPILALVAWELASVALGGSYWRHYLVNLVPGATLIVLCVRAGSLWQRLVTATVVWAVVANVGAWGHQVTAPAHVSSDARVAAFLRHHARPADGVVTAFGHPDIVAASGLRSPYSQLWSLPVRVRDHELRHFRDVLTGDRPPQWVVVAGRSLQTWGVDAAQAQDYLQRHYVERVRYGDWHVWLRQDGDRG